MGRRKSKSQPSAPKVNSKAAPAPSSAAAADVQPAASAPLPGKVIEQVSATITDLSQCTSLTHKGPLPFATGAEFTHLTKLLANATCLTSLAIDDAGIDARGATELVSSLRGNQAISSISLRGNSFGDGGARCMALLLHAAAANSDKPHVRHSLTALDVSSNGFTKVGVDHIARALQQNGKLKHLSISNNDFGDGALDAISSAVSTCTTLASLDLTNTGLSHAGLKRAQSMSQKIVTDGVDPAATTATATATVSSEASVSGDQTASTGNNPVTSPAPAPAPAPPAKKGPSAAMKKGFGALMRASKSGELEKVASTIPDDIDEQPAAAPSLERVSAAINDSNKSVTPNQHNDNKSVTPNQHNDNKSVTPNQHNDIKSVTPNQHNDNKSVTPNQHNDNKSVTPNQHNDIITQHVSALAAHSPSTNGVLSRPLSNASTTSTTKSRAASLAARSPAIATEANPKPGGTSHSSTSSSSHHQQHQRVSQGPLENQLAMLLTRERMCTQLERNLEQTRAEYEALLASAAIDEQRRSREESHIEARLAAVEEGEARWAARGDELRQWEATIEAAEKRVARHEAGANQILERVEARAQELDDRRSALDAREAELQQREARVVAKTEELDARFAEVEEIEVSLTKRLAEATEIERRADARMRACESAEVLIDDAQRDLVMGREAAEEAASLRMAEVAQRESELSIRLRSLETQMTSRLESLPLREQQQQQQQQQQHEVTALVAASGENEFIHKDNDKHRSPLTTDGNRDANIVGGGDLPDSIAMAPVSTLQSLDAKMDLGALEPPTPQRGSARSPSPMSSPQRGSLGSQRQRKGHSYHRPLGAPHAVPVPVPVPIAFMPSTSSHGHRSYRGTVSHEDRERRLRLLAKKVDAQSEWQM